MICMISGSMASEGLEASNHQKQWKLLALRIGSMNLVAKILEIIGKTNSFHDLHDFWIYGLRRFGGF